MIVLSSSVLATTINSLIKNISENALLLGEIIFNAKKLY